MKVVKPLYWIPESSIQWYLTYVGHHMDNLHMKRGTEDPFLLIKRDATELQGIEILKVYDSFWIGTKEFVKEEGAQSRSS